MSNDFFSNQLLSRCVLTEDEAVNYRTKGRLIPVNAPEGVVAVYALEDRLMIDRILLGWRAPTEPDEPYLMSDDPTSGMNPNFYWRNPQGELCPSPI